MFRNLEAEQARKNKTDSEMADILHIRRETFNKKKKSHGFSFFEITMLCKFFDQPFDYLFAIEEEEEQTV